VAVGEYSGGLIGGGGGGDCGELSIFPSPRVPLGNSICTFLEGGIGAGVMDRSCRDFNYS